MLVVSWMVFVFVASTSADTRPPYIWREPPHEVYYKVGEKVELHCEATGEPHPDYQWKRNDVAFNPSGDDARVVQLLVGTLVIYNTEDKDDGIFQCFASNSFGISVTKKVNLRQAKLENFAFAAATTYTPILGDPLTLNCVPPESVPPASVFWINKLNTGGIDVYNYNDRVSMDREYRLRFTNIIASDAAEGMPYACVVANNVTGTSSQGPLHYIKPVGTTADFRKVEYMWADTTDRFALRGDNFTVKCIFSGNPTPDVHWDRLDNKTLPSRANLKSFTQELEITNLQFEDAGAYQCWATNSISQTRVYRTFDIRVSSKPYFIDGPKNIEIGVGANVEFNCVAGGEPEPDIDWFVNGIPLRDVTDPRVKGPRFNRPLENKIVFEDVQLTDYMVIQCNASNFFGYVFANAVLNVIGSETKTTNTTPTGAATTAASDLTRPAATAEIGFMEDVEDDHNSGHSTVKACASLLAMAVILFATMVGV